MAGLNARGSRRRPTCACAGTLWRWPTSTNADAPRHNSARHRQHRRAGRPRLHPRTRQVLRGVARRRALQWALGSLVVAEAPLHRARNGWARRGYHVRPLLLPVGARPGARLHDAQVATPLRAAGLLDPVRAVALARAPSMGSSSTARGPAARRQLRLFFLCLPLPRSATSSSPAR